MDINKKVVANKLIFLLDGKFNISTVSELQNQFDKAIDEKNIHIIFDLTHIEKLNGSALEFFIKAKNLLHNLAGSMVLLRLNNNIKILLKELSLYEFFNISDDLTTAINIKTDSQPKVIIEEKPSITEPNSESCKQWEANDLSNSTNSGECKSCKFFVKKLFANTYYCKKHLK